MKTWLTFKLFGDGRGLKSPWHDDKFYWLVDTKDKERAGKNGNFYRWFGGFGAQLTSTEWFAPKAGTRRRLFNHDFVVFQTSRKFLLVEVSWALCQHDGINVEQLNKLHNRLDASV